MRSARRTRLTLEARREVLRQRLCKARTTMLLASPFYGVLATSLRIEIDADDAECTAWTDGQQMCFGLGYCEGVSDRHLTGLIAHEVLHVANLHPLRMKGRDPGRWNRACDYAINGVLTSAGYALPDGALLNPAFEGWSAERIYGSLAGEPDTSDRPARGQPGAVRAPAASSGASVQALERKLRATVGRAIKAAKRAGRMPADAERLIGETLRERQHWVADLLRYAEQQARGDYSWEHPDPVFLGHDIVIPSLHSEEIGEVVVFVDTSGSMSADDLAKARDAIEQIMQLVAPSRLHVVSADAQVRSAQCFEPGDSIGDLRMMGGGGTRFGPAFAWVEKNGIEPVVAIYLTDADGPFPRSPPPYPVIWVVNGPNSPPWGEHIRID